MKLSRTRIPIPALLLVTLLWASCKKEVSNQTFEKPQDTQNSRASGLVEDDPNRVSMVPLIMSSDLLKKAINDPALAMALRGKPIKSSDITSPTITITSPASGTSVSGITQVTVNAADNVGVTSVSLSADGHVVGSSFSAPFTLSWSPATTGSHTLMVTAIDAASNTGSSSPISVTVSTLSGGPKVSITDPVAGEVLYGTVNVSISATASIGIKSVKFSVDNTLIGTYTTYPYYLLWNTSTYATGLHTITATATDASGISSSYSIPVEVNTTILPAGSLPTS